MQKAAQNAANVGEQNKMKARNGFVSNSSSSCFIITNPKWNNKNVLPILQRILNGYNIMFEKDNKLGEILFLVDKEQVQEELSMLQRDWGDDYSDIPASASVIIYSLSDNTIPYEMFDPIINAFDATRFHLG